METRQLLPVYQQQSVNNYEAPYNFSVNPENRLFVKNTDPNSRTGYKTGSNFLSITSESYRQGMLNAIARLNTISQSSNAVGLGAFSKMFSGKNGDTNANPNNNSQIREEKIRSALQDIINSQPGFLGEYSGAQALSSATKNYGILSQNTLTKLGNTRRDIGAKARGFFGFGGKKTRRNKKSRKHRKH
jgi:hypothetical protein